MQIGEVVDAVGSGRKQLHEGKEYDYVFDVDVQEGVPPLKLPYNVSGGLPVEFVCGNINTTQRTRGRRRNDSLLRTICRRRIQTRL